MKLNDTQCERIARWLDGQDVPLSDLERAAAEQIRRREALLGALLDSPVPLEIHAHVAAAVRRELHRRSRRRVLRIVIDLAAVAAAAVVLVALLLPAPAPAPQPAIPTAVLFDDDYRPAGAVALDAIAEQADQVEARLVAALPPVPEEGVATPAADTHRGKVLDNPWLEGLLQNLSS